MRKDESIESFLSKVNIKFVADQVKEAANTQMSAFLGGKESYIENCSIYIGMMEEHVRGLPTTDEKGYMLLPQIDSEVQCIGIEKDEIQEFENAMREEIEGQTGDDEKDHYVIGHSQYGGSGHNRTEKDNDEDLYAYNFVSWCVYSPEKSLISRLVSKVILLFLEACFRDPEEIRSLSSKDNTAAQEWLKKCLKEIKFHFINEYVDEVGQTYHVDINSCNKISMAPYEKRVCKGRALFVPEGVELCKLGKTVIMFENSDEESELRKMSDIQGTRKFLEVCQEGYLLIRESNKELIGILFDEEVASLYTVVQFRGLASWELKIGQEMILCYKQGDYFATTADYEKTLYTVIEEYANIPFAEKIVDTLKETSHGALMIIAKDAETEAERLAKVNRAVKVETFSVDGDYGKKMIASMADIDGAILVDYDGRCTAFGVILDGEARVKGEEERGARYNSAMNYIGGEERIAIVVSEDRTKGIIVEYGKNITLVTNKK